MPPKKPAGRRGPAPAPGLAPPRPTPSAAGAALAAGAPAATPAAGIVLDGELLASVRALIAAARHHVAQRVNATLVLLYWEVGDRLRHEVLQEGRAAYGRQAVERLADELTREFGSGYTRANLFHMARFAEAFPDRGLVDGLAERLSWTHLRTLTYVADPLARQFYAEMARV